MSIGLTATVGTLVFLSLGTGAFVVHQLAAIDRDTHDIAQNAGPSIEYLADVRGELQLIGAELDEMEDELESGQPVDSRELDNARRRLSAATDGYLALPVFPGERQAWDEAARAMGPLESGIADATRALDDRDLPRARESVRRFRAMNNAMLPALVRVIRLNAEAARSAALHIARVRHHANVTLTWLALADLALTSIIAWAALRTMRRYERLLYAQRDEAQARAEELDAFASRMAHDVRSPLTTVSLAVQSIARKSTDPDSRESAVRARRGIDRASGVVEALLHFARAGTRPDPDARADAHATIESLVEEIQPEAREARVELRAEPGPALEVACEPELVAIAVTNFVRNAIKYLGDADKRMVQVRVFPRGDFARIEVEDTGPGVPPSLRDTLFQPYVRAPGLRQPGLGLGLATVERICRSRGGRVGVRDAAGHGSVFWLELPRAGVHSAA